MKLAAILALWASIIYILLLAIHPAYSMHLYPDVFAFHARSSYFWEHLTLSGLGHNEYQPGAITFFISLSPVFLISSSIESFKWALFASNILFIYLLAELLIRMKKTAGVFLLSLMLIFLGPIVFFRFDLLVILLSVFTFYLWEKGYRETGMFILAFAVITKVYPVIFLPYLLFLSFKKGKKIEPLYLFFIFTGSFLTYLLAYTYFFQINLPETFASYNFHNLKSLATESVWASAIYFYRLISLQPLPAMESAYGINAIARSEVFPSIQFFNYFWMIPLGLLYLVYFFRNKQSLRSNDLKQSLRSNDLKQSLRSNDLKHWEKIDYQFLSLLLLVFLIFSKVLSNQYLAWFLLMIPLIDIKILFRKTWIINIFLIILTTILHTFIYPLNYSSWLAVFTERRIDLFLLWVMIISSFILPVLALRIGFNVFKNNN